MTPRSTSRASMEVGDPTVNNLPPWVWNLLVDVARYEDEHGHVTEGYFCFHRARKEIPKEIWDKAALWNEATLFVQSVVEEKQ